MDEQVIIKVDLDAQQVASKLQNVNNSISALKDQQKRLQDSIKTTGDATGEMTQKYAKNAEALKLLQSEQKALTGQLQANSNETLKLGDSFREMDAQVRALENQYKSLTAAQRESAAGQELKQQIITGKEALKEFDAELGNHQRNVGNYNEAIGTLFPAFDKLNNTLTKAKGMLDNFNKTTQAANASGKAAPSAFSGMAQGIGSVTKAGLKFIATPLGAAIAAIAVVVKVLQAVFGKLAEAFKKNDDAGTSLQKLFAVFQPIIDGITKAFDMLASAIGKAAEKMAQWVGGKSEAVKASQELVTAQDNLEQAEREYTENKAKRERDIAKLRADAKDKEKYSVQERKAMLQQAIQLEQANLKEDTRIKKEQLRLLEEKAKRERDTSDETKNKIAAARAAMYQAEQQYYTGVRKLQSELTTFDNEEKAAQKAAAQEAAQRRKEQADRAKQQAAEAKQRRKDREQQEREYQDFRKQILQETEDALLGIEKDGSEKEIAQVKLASEREIAELKARAKKIRKNDVEAQQSLNTLIETKEKEAQDKMTAIATTAILQRTQAERELRQQAEDLRVTDEMVLAQREVERKQTELNEILALTKDQQAVMFENENAYQQAVLDAKRAAYDAQNALDAEQRARQEQADANYWEQRKNNAGTNEVELAQIELEQAMQQNDTLVNMDAETKAKLYHSQEEYEAAMIASNKRLADAQQNATQTMVKDATTKANAVAGAIGALSGLLDQFGEDNKAAAIASKALAIGQIAVQTGIALAEGIAAAQAAGPFPANLIAIATTVTTILTNIATAVSTVKSAKFATGGIVGGTSYTGDKVPIAANSREMVLNLDQQKTLFDALSGGNGQTNLGVDYGLMAAAMASTPAPVVVYSEMQEFGQRVATYNEIASV